MTFTEWVAQGGKFKLHGGPLDGREESPQVVPGIEGWPSVIVLEGHLYSMRIGDLEVYDYAGDAP